MRFIVIITFQSTRIASASVMTQEGETPAALADRAREAIMRDANRGRSSALTETALVGVADAFRAASEAQAASGKALRLTCVARLKDDGTHSVAVIPGDYATLTRKGDLMAHIEIMSDEDVARSDELVDSILRPAAG